MNGNGKRAALLGIIGGFVGVIVTLLLTWGNMVARVARIEEAAAGIAHDVEAVVIQSSALQAANLRICERLATLEALVRRSQE